MFEHEQLTDKIEEFAKIAESMRFAQQVLRVAGNTFNENQEILYKDEFESQRDELEHMIKESMKNIITGVHSSGELLDEIRTNASSFIDSIQKETVAR